jgi:hypothetical protein
MATRIKVSDKHGKAIANELEKITGSLRAIGKKMSNMDMPGFHDPSIRPKTGEFSLHTDKEGKHYSLTGKYKDPQGDVYAISITYIPK